MPLVLGKKQEELLRWLQEDWLPNGPNVCFVEGFSGVGKSMLARIFLGKAAAAQRTAVMINLPEAEATRLDDLLLEAATEFHDKGLPQLADAVDAGQDLSRTLIRLLEQPVLLIVDEFQRAFSPGAGRPQGGPLAGLLDRLERREQQGRVLLLTNHSVERARWSEPHAIRHLPGLEPEEAEAMLRGLVQGEQLEHEVSPSQLREVVLTLGCNPGALGILVACLRYESLGNLLGAVPELWEFRHRHISADLLEQLKARLLQRPLERLEREEAASLEVLKLLSVHRKPVEKEALQGLAQEPQKLLEKLFESFLIEHHQQWYSPKSVVWEIMRRELEADPALRRFHSLAADYYARHFRAKQMVGAGRLGGHFVEARFHLVLSDREDELAAIAARFAVHLQTTIGPTSSLPRTEKELNEHIALLMGFLETEGPKRWEYRLARCFLARGREGDRQRALEHARRAAGPASPAEAWVLRISLEGELCGLEEALEATREGARHVSSQENLFTLYVKGAELLSAGGRAPQAIDLLKEGMGRIKPENNLFALYVKCAELLAAADRLPEAIGLLKEGMGRIEPEKNLYALYQCGGAILDAAGRQEEALSFLRQGLRVLPTGKGYRYRLASAALYQCVGRGNQAGLAELLQDAGPESLDAPVAALGRVLQRQLREDWAGAAAAAGEARGAFPRYLELAVQEAFSLLCASDPQGAREALDRLPGVISDEAGSPQTWLRAFIALKEGQPEEAAKFVDLYRGRPLAPDEDCNVALLLHLWDEADGRVGGINPTFSFPCLPLALTGLSAPKTWRRRGPGRPPPATARVAPGGFLAVATEWFSRHGGVSTFNRELCLALARAGQRVVCLVPGAFPEETEQARQGGVELIPVTAALGLDEISRLCRRPPLPAGWEPQFLLGHDRVTGPAARALVEDFFPHARRLQFIHTAPGEIEWFKDHSAQPGAAATAEERERLQLDLAKSAHLLAAVGPRLFREFEHVLGGVPGPQRPRLVKIIPGLGEAEPPREPTGLISCLVLGRAEDAELKGLDIAARALALVQDLNAELVVRGVPPGGWKELRGQLLNAGGRPGQAIRVKEYTQDPEVVKQDLRRASLLLLPSRKEGFGLVGVEAITLGTPVLVSDQSGLGELLQTELGEDAGIYVVPVTGDLEIDGPRWKESIMIVLRDRTAASRRAQELRERLATVLSWEKAVADLLGLLGNSGL